MESGLVAGTLVEGKYKILRLIGRGGMGSVYEGENVRIGRRVAIKVLHHALATDRRLVDRFEREAQAVARIGSHHVADVLDFGELATGDRFMVMEYLRGQSLAERLGDQGALPPAKVIAVAAQLLDGLAVTHDAGIIHRDLKPANIFLAESTSGDFVKILDFGIAKFRAAGDIQWTTSGSTVLGTPGYLSPEQLMSETVGPTADLYAVGVIIYRCIAGRLPYDAMTKAELLIQIRDGLRIPITRLIPDLDADLAALVMKGIAPALEDRFSTAKDYRAALLAWAEGAEHREDLLAEFLGRPKTTSFVPAVASQPPRFRVQIDPASGGGSLVQQALESLARSPDIIPEDTVPTSRPDVPDVGSGDAATPGTPTALGPQAEALTNDAALVPLVPGASDRDEPTMMTRDAGRGARMKAIFVGAAVGIASALALYAALRL